jgi:alanine-synthesizing transaminase
MFPKKFDYDLTENPLAKLYNKKKSNNERIYDLTISNPTNIGFKFDTNKILSSISRYESVFYNPHPSGLISARNAVRNYYSEIGKVVNADSIILTSGTSEAYSYLFKLLTNPNDEILIPFPSYPLIDIITGLENISAVRYPMIYDSSWHLDFEKLENLISVKTKAIIVINPNNPTGSYIKNEELENLNNICSKRGIAIISDEVFYDYKIEKEVISGSLAGNNQVLTFVLSGLSKICALPQLKLSWIQVNAPDNLLSQTLERLEMISDTYLTVNTPVQLAAKHLIPGRKNIQEQIIQRIQKNLNYLKKIISTKNGTSLLKPEGGWYAVIKINDDISDEDRALMLLEKYNVYVHPGYFYDFEQDGYLVLSLITPEEDFKMGIISIINNL